MHVPVLLRELVDWKPRKWTIYRFLYSMKRTPMDSELKSNPSFSLIASWAMSSMSASWTYQPLPSTSTGIMRLLLVKNTQVKIPGIECLLGCMVMRHSWLPDTESKKICASSWTLSSLDRDRFATHGSFYGLATPSCFSKTGLSIQFSDG